MAALEGARDSSSTGHSDSPYGAGRGLGAGLWSRHLQDELVRLAEAAGRLAEGLVALLLVGVRREEQQLCQMRGLQAPGLHAHQHLAQLRGAQLQVRQEDGCGRGGAVSGRGGGGAGWDPRRRGTGRGGEKRGRGGAYRRGRGLEATGTRNADRDQRMR